MADKIFAEGISFYEAPKNAPRWVKGRISVNVNKFCDFVSKCANERGWVNFDVKESKNGTLYVELNTYGQKKNNTTEPRTPFAV